MESGPGHFDETSTYVVSALRRTVTVPLEPDTCHNVKEPTTEGNIEDTKTLDTDEKHDRRQGLNAEPAKPAEVARATAAGAAGRERNVKGLANANGTKTARVCVCEALFVSRPAPRAVRARGSLCISWPWCPSCSSWFEAVSSLRALRALRSMSYVRQCLQRAFRPR
jgi:hypothetical protein